MDGIPSDKRMTRSAPHLSPGSIFLGYLDAGLWHREPSFPSRSSALTSEHYQPPSQSQVSSDSRSQAQMEETPEVTVKGRGCMCGAPLRLLCIQKLSQMALIAWTVQENKLIKIHRHQSVRKHLPDCWRTVSELEWSGGMKSLAKFYITIW